MTQPFCCDITSGTKEEQDEFIRLHREACYKFNGGTYSYVIEYFGVDEEGTPLGLSYGDEKLVKKWFNNNILPLSEGILILKKMVGEEEKPQTDLKVVRDRIVDAVHKSLQWKDGEIGGINMMQLEQRIDGILDSLQPKPTE